jgi:hypothetical protein
MLGFEICEEDTKCVKATNCPLAIEVTTFGDLIRDNGFVRRYVRGFYNKCSPEYERESEVE